MFLKSLHEIINTLFVASRRKLLKLPELSTVEALLPLSTYLLLFLIATHTHHECCAGGRDVSIGFLILSPIKIR